MIQERFHRLTEHFKQGGDRSCRDSTATEESDSSSPEQTMRLRRDPIIKTIPEKHKTELCKSFSELGSCRYGQKCRFAHGHQQLKKVRTSNENYRTRPCKNYWEGGQCKYGIRCQFNHQNKLGWQQRASLAALTAVFLELHHDSPNQSSRLLKLLN